jgi:hypothetical protein
VNRRSLRSFALAAALVLLGACAGAPPAMPPVPPPPLALQSTAELQIPAGCAVPAAEIVRVDYQVTAEGRVAAPRATGRDDCIAAELERWVGSFRYAPPPSATVATLEWVAVRP